MGALTSKDYRFTMRAWELMSTPQLCNGCSTGCNIEIHHRGGRTYRLIPRENPEVNGHWMCDEGRFTYHSLTEKRLVGPLVSGMPSNWKRATTAAADKLKEALDADAGSVGVVFSPHRTNEENYVLAKFVKDTLKVERLYMGGCAPAPDRADDILRKADKSPNRAGVKAILGEVELGGLAVLEDDILGGDIKALIVLGHELSLGAEAIAKAESLDCLVVISDHEEGLTTKAHVALPVPAWAENTGSVTNFEGRVQRMQSAYDGVGQVRPGWRIFADLSTELGTELSYDSAQAVFKEMKSKVSAFSDAKWGRDLPAVQLRFAHSRG